LEAPAFAKLNLTLEVLGRRDDGYHEIRSVLQTIDLADRLEIVPASSLSVECDDASLNGETNLVWRAAAALAERGNTEPRAHIYIHKRIPVAMGLGGGSSDAATALMVLNQLWGLDLTIEDLAQVAGTIGSDVAFFLSGGTALVTGRGEQVTPLPPLPSVAVILVCPKSTVPNKTASVYSALTPGQYSDGGITRRMTEILLGGHFVRESVAGLLYNVFDEVASRVFPDLGRVRRQLDELALGRYRLTGAGPGLFGLPSSELDYQRVANALQPYGAEVYLVVTTSPESFAGVETR
jgi:4-diphosphocytidyl-2-C-methyl-D-erythritol kinase